jgi:hypothetical protein
MWVAGRRSLITPVATPAPIVSDSKEDANRIDSIPRDDVDERAHDDASLITNELYIDRDNLPRIQLPQLNSPKTKEASQRLTVPLTPRLWTVQPTPLLLTTST